jgi:preprotein translocase subunit Sss1
VKDGGFDFGPKERRERRGFEVPPWEQDAFERMREDAEPEALAEAGVTEPTPNLDAVVPQVVAEPVAQEVVEEAAMPAAPASVQKVDEARVTEMLAVLAVEDKPAAQGFWKIAIAAALVLMGIGIMLLVWGMAAAIKSRQTGGLGSAGGMTLTVVGAAFVGIAVYLVVKTLRDRGVL